MGIRRVAQLLTSSVLGAAATFEARDCYVRSPVHQYQNDFSTSQSTLNSPYSWLSNLKVINWIRSSYIKLILPITASAESVSADQPITPWNWNWDNRHQSADSPGGAGDVKRRSCSRHLIFIRHGQYHYADSDVECRLTQLGREQLNLTGLRLKHLNLPYKTIHYSTMTRAIESTEQILKHLPDVPVRPTEALREGAPYPLEPPLPNYRPSAETLRCDGERIESAFRSFVHRPEADQTDDTYEVFVCHANVIRYIVCRALQFPPEAWIRFSLDHGSITWLVIRPDGRVALRGLGSSGHMPSDKISVQ